MSRTIPHEGNKNKITGIRTTLPKDSGFLFLICASSQDASWKREGWTERCLCLRDPNDSPVNWNGRLFVLIVSIVHQFYSCQVKITRSYFGVGSFIHHYTFTPIQPYYHTHTTILSHQHNHNYHTHTTIPTHPYNHTITRIQPYTQSVNISLLPRVK